MTKNNLLNIAIVICKVLQGFYILGFLILTLVFIHVQVDGGFYHDKIISIEKENLTYNDSVTLTSENRGQTLDQMSTTTLYLTYMKYCCVLALLFLAIKEFQKIIKSVQNLTTFQNENFKSFRRIGQYGFVYFLVTSFYSYDFNHVRSSGFIISLTPLIVMLFAFIMAEIFKEGSLLREEKELTI